MPGTNVIIHNKVGDTEMTTKAYSDSNTKISTHYLDTRTILYTIPYKVPGPMVGYTKAYNNIPDKAVPNADGYKESNFNNVGPNPSTTPGHVPLDIEVPDPDDHFAVHVENNIDNNIHVDRNSKVTERPENEINNRLEPTVYSEHFKWIVTDDLGPVSINLIHLALNPIFRGSKNLGSFK